jgi:hypothetical protein
MPVEGAQHPRQRFTVLVRAPKQGVPGRPLSSGSPRVQFQLNPHGPSFGLGRRSFA